VQVRPHDATPDTVWATTFQLERCGSQFFTIESIFMMTFFQSGLSQSLFLRSAQKARRKLSSLLRKIVAFIVALSGSNKGPDRRTI
jgi:hypothetical protein